MQIRALFFATYRDIAHADELSLELPAGASVADLIARLREHGAAWAAFPAAPVAAVNLSYARLDTVLADGDEVAFIPPVSGG